MKSFPVYKQFDQMDCGPTCLRMIAKFYGKHYSLKSLREAAHITREGVDMRGISEASEQIGFRSFGAKITFEQLDQQATLPCILHWNQNHFVVLPPQKYDSSKKNSRIIVIDPAYGKRTLTREAFLKSWISTENRMGIVLMLEPTPDFFTKDGESEKTSNLSFFLTYLSPYKRYIFQILLGMVLGSLFSLVFPFLTQSLIDFGINQQNIGFTYLILFSQLFLFLGGAAIEMVRGWLLLHMNTRVNIAIISDFLIKLMKLPIRFFDSKMVGDITQRIQDHNRIEQFLTATTLNTLFSLLNIIVFSVVLAIYSLKILAIFMIGSSVSVSWILLFLAKRRDLDYVRFQQQSANQNNLFEIITGMQEIKLNNSETNKRWGWERIQAKLFKVGIRSMALEQYQMLGVNLSTQLKNILITFVAAQEVIHGTLTLGMMLSISYITGQMNGPIEHLLGFFRSAQDARISIDRLGEIQQQDDEEKPSYVRLDKELALLHTVEQAGAGLVLDKVSFQYEGPDSAFVLKDVSLTIPFGKVTAVVGSSGSGKTTLLKLLLRFYDPVAGIIKVGATPLTNVSPKWWRAQCGSVMQEGYIFSDTIAHNIAIQDDINEEQLAIALRTANLASTVAAMPLGLATKIGMSGNGISGGQRQRMLIARAVYKNPQFIFLDEATSSLDANNERIIIDNLESFFQHRTVVVIAHRLSTVKHADQIVVLEQGQVVEVGDHATLTAKRGRYFELVKNQLELGN
ncbi:peptidase domain-containing ABC transporter [Hymenobacter sp. DH14]|uniref:Peptidase domain-containing ABC transporter n=1 Tax=Hymenobacter cyanobacteriorum TaxID=2926463 RepID=A0A9X1VJN0_9BACT|nr:peptidase domain-containing ABC transporter [Hymenobacter cyanobacteriorum]MCI1189900.1 peptidase domain-containing ABC transporter [Hymenobacter cyanobacteriorum]